MSLLYAASILAWFLAARVFGARAACSTAVVLLAVSGLRDPLPRALVGRGLRGGVRRLVAARWCSMLRSPSLRCASRSSARASAILTLVRPANQVAARARPAAAGARAPVADRLAWRVAFVVPAVVLIGGWAVHNGIRYGNYTIARGGNATVPFFRAFVTDQHRAARRTARRRELARAVQRDLLPKEPYRSYGITSTSSSRRRARGCRSTCSRSPTGSGAGTATTTGCATSASRRCGPTRRTYARGVAGEHVRDCCSSPALPRTAGRPPVARRTPATVDVGGEALPAPSEGEPIPAAARGRRHDPGRKHLHGLDVADGAPPGLRPSRREAALQRPPPPDGRARREPAGPRRERVARAPPQPGSRLVPPAVVWLVLGGGRPRVGAGRGDSSRSRPHSRRCS